MNGKQVKELRSQLKNLVREMLPELLAAEYYVRLTEQNKKQLDLVQSLVKDTLTRIDERQKTIQEAVIRELAKSSSAAPTTPVVPEQPGDTV